MKASGAYPSRWIQVTDLDEGGTLFTIEAYSLERLKDEKGSKPVLSFRNWDKRLILNKTNNDYLIKLLGDETDDWIGRKIVLYSTPVSFAGKTTDGIRIRSFKSKANGPEPEYVPEQELELEREPELDHNPNSEPVPF